MNKFNISVTKKIGPFSPILAKAEAFLSKIPFFKVEAGRDQ